MTFKSLSPALLCVLALGCSSFIKPDQDRLGGGDGGSADGGVSGDGGDDDDGGAVCPPSCADEIDCTADSCVDGRCEHEPDDDACGDEERCSPVLGCVPEHCTRDAECDNAIFCDGVERCDPEGPGTGCVDDADILCTDDGSSCTLERCDEDRGTCVSEPNDDLCDDGVDCTDDVCDPRVATDATGCAHEADDSFCESDFCTVGRTCDSEVGCVGGTPRACDVDYCTRDTCEAPDTCTALPYDDDGDTFTASSVIGPDGIVACAGRDCNDALAEVNPDAAEVCNGRDDNCDGAIDEGCGTDPGESCDDPIVLTLDGDGNATATGNFGDFADDHETNEICDADDGGRDVVYAVDLRAGEWDLTIDTIDSTGARVADTVLGFGTTCSDAGLQLACNDDYNDAFGVISSRIWVHRINAGFVGTRVYILVDGYSAATSGDFVLNVRRRNAAPDSCPVGGGASPLEISGGGTVYGYVSSFLGSISGTCQGDGDFSPEAIFRVRGPAAGSVAFDVYSEDFATDIYFRDRPCSDGTEIECTVGASLPGGGFSARLTATTIDDTLYYFFVDGGMGTYSIYYQP
jgi:hypothetical protein